MGIQSDGIGRRINGKSAFRVALCLLIAIPVLFALTRMVAEMDHALIVSSLAAIPTVSIAASVLLTILSFMAVARYDDMALRLLGHKIPKSEAIKCGFIATSLSQSLGFGFFVGTIARWRCYRVFGLSMADVAIVSGVVIVGFMTGFAVVLSLATVINPEGLAILSGANKFAVRATATLVLLAAASFLILSLLVPRFSAFGRSFSLPPIKVLTTQVYLAAFDVIPAALALWVLIPAEIAPSAWVIVPVYLTALGLGLMSNAPGGVGVLELTCLLALPMVPGEQLLAALILHRAIYFGAPILIATALLIAREISDDPIPQAAANSGNLHDILSRSHRADAGLALLGDKSFVFSDCGRAFLMYAEANNALVSVSDPVGPENLWPELIAKFRELGRRRFRIVTYYRVSQGFAAHLIRADQGVEQIGVEARVELSGYSTNGSDKRELRRKLKQSEKAGLYLINHHAGAAPMGRYASVAEEWANAKRGQRGFSMGYFDRNYIGNFASIEARVGNRTVGFLSIWRSGDGTEHGLDVMRLCDDAPDGAMHALTHAAISAAKEAGATHFSLASVPFAGVETPDSAFEMAVQWAYSNRPNWHGSHGLYRFKNAFRPEWAPQFVAAPSAVAMGIGLLETARLIHGTDCSDAQETEDQDLAVLA